MTVLRDSRDNPLSGASDAAVTDYMEGLGQLNLYTGDPVASAEAATADSPRFVMGHALRAWLYLAFVGSGRRDLTEQVLAAQRIAMARDDDNAGFTRDAGHAATLTMQGFGDERYDEVVRLIRPIRAIANRFGGSHAQRDVLDLTLIEAALRAGVRDLAKALAAERVAVKPTSPLAGLFARRAA
jgi:hypothetical protein